MNHIILRDSVTLLFGLDSGTERTLDEVAALMGLSRGRVWHIKVRALSALRRPEIRVRFEDSAGQ